MNFIVTASVEALEGLIDDRVLAIWKNFRKGFMIHTQKKVITPEDRNEAKCAFFQVGVGCEQVFSFSFFFVLFCFVCLIVLSNWSILSIL